VATSSELVIDALMAQLEVVRGIEGTEPASFEHQFGNLKDSEHGPTPRIVWIHEGGIVLETEKNPVVADGEPQPVGQRRALYRARLRFKMKEECELTLDQLVRAGRLLPVPDRVLFEGARYEFITQVEGRHIEGAHLLDAMIGVHVPIPAEPIDADAEVEIASTEIRTGIESPAGEAESATAYEVNEWVDPDVTSES